MQLKNYRGLIVPIRPFRAYKASYPHMPYKAHPSIHHACTPHPSIHIHTSIVIGGMVKQLFFLTYMYMMRVDGTVAFSAARLLDSYSPEHEVDAR